MIFSPDQPAFVVRPPKPSRTTITETRIVDLRFVALEASLDAIRRDQANHVDTKQLDSSTPAGRRALRGIPVIANGVGGTQPGTNPLAETLARSEQSRRDRMTS